MNLMLLVASAAVAVAQASAGEAPEALVRAGGANPVTFVQILAEAGIPAGLEVRRSDFQRISNSQRDWNPKDWSPERLAGQRRVPIEAVVDAFNQGRLDYKATLMGGVIVIRPVRDAAEYLDSDPKLGHVAERGLMRLAERVFAPLDPSLDQPGGRAGSSLGPVGVEIDHGDELELSIESGGLSVIQILNHIAIAAPGHPWLVIAGGAKPSKVERFGFVHRHGTTTTFGVH